MFFFFFQLMIIVISLGQSCLLSKLRQKFYIRYRCILNHYRTCILHKMFTENILWCMCERKRTCGAEYKFSTKFDGWDRVNNNTSPGFFSVQNAYPNPVWGSRHKLRKKHRNVDRLKISEKLQLNKGSVLPVKISWRSYGTYGYDCFQVSDPDFVGRICWFVS